MKQNAIGNGIITSIVVVCVGVLLATTVHAQPGFRGPDGPRGGPRGMPGLRDLDLSQTQNDTIRGIVEQNRETGQGMGEQAGAARMALNEAVLSESFNESNVRTLAGQLAALEADAAVQRAYVSSQIWQVLTSDQKAELRELQADAMEQRVEQRGEGRGRRGRRR